MLTAVGSKEIRDMIIGTGMETGAQEGLDILDEIVAELTARRPRQRNDSERRAREHRAGRTRRSRR